MDSTERPKYSTRDHEKSSVGVLGNADVSVSSPTNPAQNASVLMIRRNPAMLKARPEVKKKKNPRGEPLLGA